MLVAKREVYSYREDNNIETTSKVKKIKKTNSSLKIKVFGMALLILFVSLGVLFRYAQMTQIKMEVSKLDKQINELSKHKTDVLLELDRIKESGWIEKEAESKLGMVYPSNEQIVYVSVNMNDNDIHKDIVKEDKTEKLAFLKLFSNVVSKISNKF